MKERFKKPIKLILGIEKARRNVTVLDDDVYITSYPRSGNTWVRFLIANLLWLDGSTNFLNIEKRIPDIYKFSDSHLLSLPRPRFLKSHEYLDLRYPKVLYIVRDVRSVIISYWYYMKRNGEIDSDISLTEYTILFISGDINFHGFGTWSDNVQSWIRIRGQSPERFCLIRYEDLKIDRMGILRIINSFLELQRNDDQLNFALKMSSFNRMKKLEKEAGKGWEETKYVKNSGIDFIRAGKNFEWQGILDKESLNLIEDNYSEILLELGYEL
jgi:hypothetical protein